MLFSSPPNWKKWSKQTDSSHGLLQLKFESTHNLNFGSNFKGSKKITQTSTVKKNETKRSQQYHTALRSPNKEHWFLCPQKENEHNSRPAIKFQLLSNIIDTVRWIPTLVSLKSSEIFIRNARADKQIKIKQNFIARNDSSTTFVFTFLCRFVIYVVYKTASAVSICVWHVMCYVAIWTHMKCQSGFHAICAVCWLSIRNCLCRI